MRRRPSVARQTGAMDKSELRRVVRARRAAVPPSVRAERDGAILVGLGEIVSAGMVVCAYVPDDDEAGGSGLLSRLVDSGARVLLPVSPAVGPLGWAEYAGPADLAPGRFGIPVPSAPPDGPETIAGADLVLVPAVAVDRRGNRLGRGKGFYDRLLSSTKATKIGVAYEFQLVDSIPTEPHDVKMDLVITQSGIHVIR